MIGQVLADFCAAAGDHVEYAVRQTGFGIDFRQLQRRQGSDFTGFEDHRVACRQCRCGFPQGNLDRVVPGANTGHHAQGLTTGINKGAVTQWDLLAFDRRDQTRVIFQYVGTGNDIHRRGFRHGLAGIQRFQRGQFVVAFAQNIHRSAQNTRTFHRRHRRPHFLSAGCTGHRTVDVFSAGRLDLGKHFTVRRVNRVESFSIGTVYIGTINIELL
ncbi:hypothetical protein D3C72_1497350 [compost metagenome]